MYALFSRLLDDVKPWVLRAIGVHEMGAEAREKLKPDSLTWSLISFTRGFGTQPLHCGSREQPGVCACGARSVNARLQQRLGRRDRSEAALCREAFSPRDPTAEQPRLRFAGDRTSDTWKSRQQGGVDFGAGCFEGIRNPAAHEDSLNLPERIALEQLAAFSLLARWIEECTIEAISSNAEANDT